MRFLVLTREFPPHVIGGLSYHLAHLYTALVEQGHEVTVVTGVARDAEEAAANLVHDDITVHTVEYGRFAGQHLKFPLCIRRQLRNLPVTTFDVAIAHTPLPYGLPIPTVGKIHDCPQEERQYYQRERTHVERVADTLVNPTRRFVDRRFLAATDHLIFNSELCLRAWERHYDVPDSRTVVYNGVDTDVFLPREDVPDEEYVLFVGDSVRKGLLEVSAYAKQADHRVFVVGDVTEPGSNLETFGRQSQPELARLYAGAVATVHPAKFEAFGNTVLESLACGTPVVTTRQCGASELLTAECGRVDVSLQTGVEECRTLEVDDCVSRARDRAWSTVAVETANVLRGVL